ncbi:hypothetical protein DFJ74DRAFT_685921 [Hyaloraphidium curvatum]|nr:hypothetical protein DFJ74DRAFT_685921 [Hyaloraphidium curvatum]
MAAPLRSLFSRLASLAPAFARPARAPAPAALAPLGLSALQRHQPRPWEPAAAARPYYVKSSIKLLCEHCYFVRRRGRLQVQCHKTGRHKQRQG